MQVQLVQERIFYISLPFFYIQMKINIWTEVEVHVGRVSNGPSVFKRDGIGTAALIEV
jgi:hypothetical protein